MKVFVSYSRKDTEFVDRLDRELTALGHDVWVDRSDLVGGGEDRWRRSIVNAIRDSEAMLLVLSPSSIASDNVERELSVAADNKKRVIPVVHQQCEMPSGFEYELAGLQYVDFTTMKYDEAVAQLSAQLRPSVGAVVNGVPDAPAPTPPVRPSGDKERRVRTFLWVGGAAVVAVAIGLLVVVMTGDEDPGRTSEAPRTTQATATGESLAPSTDQNSSATSAGSNGTTSSAVSTTAPPQPDGQRATDVVLEWFAATSARNWDRVLEIDPTPLSSPYEEWYGRLSDDQHMESIEPYIYGVSQTAEPGTWLITGAVVAYDTRPADPAFPDGYRTNFVCSKWSVDLNVQPAPTSHWTIVRDQAQRTAQKVPPAEFASMYADTCLA
jgi:hypothetical protein